MLGGELLQARLPVQPGAEAGGRGHQRVEEPVDHLAGDLEAAAEVDRADHRLDGVGEDRRLVRPPVISSPRPSWTCSPSPIVAGHVGQRAGVDDRGAQLGQLALGEVGVGPVERLGDDDAEHRVAEELQPLVGGQPAVLVGVRAVGQGALEQLGVERRVPERLPQVVVVGRRTRRSPADWSEDRPTVRRGSRTRRTAGRRGAAGAWRRRPGWRRSPATARRPSTANGGGACCCATSSASGQPLFYSSVWPRSRPVRCWCSVLGLGPARSCRPAPAAPPTGGRPASSCRWSGSSASRAPHSAHSPGTVVLAQRLERQCEHHRVPQQRLEVEQVALEPAGLVVLRRPRSAVPSS